MDRRIVRAWVGACAILAMMGSVALRAEAQESPFSFQLEYAPADAPSEDGGAADSPDEVQEIEEIEDLFGEEAVEEGPRPIFRLDKRDLVITGFMFSRLRIKDETSTQTMLEFNPVILWNINDRLFLESELEIGWNNYSHETTVELGYLNLSYLATDYLTLSVGKFLVPFGLFSERVHPAWINKLPDAPLPFGHDGLVPGAAPGFMARGGFSTGISKFNYSAYLITQPRLVAEGGEAGGIDFEYGNWNWAESTADSFSGLAFGGRIGFLPVPEVELGYSLYVAPKLSGDVDAVVQGLDMSFYRDVDWLKGHVDARVEWVWSEVGDRFYGRPGAYYTFNNNRNGGYAQVAYRPTMLGSEFLKKFEAVVRYDRLTQPIRSGGSEQRVTVGLNYWIKPSVVVKAAYQFDDKRGDARDQNAFFLQFGWGFGDLLGGLK